VPVLNAILGGTLKKRSVVYRGRKSSVSLEEPFWAALKEIADQRGQFIGQLIGEIDNRRVSSNLSSSIRVFVLEHFRLPGPSEDGAAGS